MRSETPIRLLIASQPMAEGVPQHVVDVLSELDLDRYEVDLVCPRGSTLWTWAQDRERIRVHEIGAARGLAATDLVSLGGLWRLVRHAGVIHAHSAKAGFLARLAARLRGRSEKCIFTPHAWSFWSAVGWRRRLYLWLERRAARWCRLIVVVSEHERAAGLAARIGVPEQYRVVVNGVDLDRFTGVARRPHPGRIVMVGRLTQQKRPDLAVEAFSAVRARYPEAQLHLVGDGPWERRIETLVRDRGLTKSVRLLGSRSDIPALLAAATGFVLASDYEGCPLSLIEAMAAAVPVVATNVGGVPELVEHGRTGLLVPPGDVSELARAICALLEDPEHARRMGEAGRAVAHDRLSRKRMAHQIAGLYDEIAGEAARSER